ncbi:UDP-N-acetyl-D-glucosamine dehydrogenase [Siminovitchia terrae]|uniref:Nucleotide sugar dehydrogenase n=1 Tax=Siminovitchia terrae TaxID=1914933 RepID=A0A429XCG5_SIMTE|nr:nucleotide sugar dehydrogenase [Siminovitchia terrae]RST60663.1 nucleotide sugar dehydrogenase [Siminovitchia terrae]GIN94831.1 UDP-N-acetyl-D-glucosamine dehydrogenase [Siminovitchia terrae]
MESHNSQKERDKIAVIGLGYVGLPLAVMLAEKGFRVIGIDRDANKVTMLQQARSYIGDVSDSTLKALADTGRFQSTGDFDKLQEVNSIIICVPTPITVQKTPDLTYIISVGNDIQTRLHKGQLVILESSTYPGTTTDVLLPILEKSGLTVGEDFFLANSPERIDPGNDRYRVDEIPKVLGGTTENCLERALSLYSQIYKQVVPVSSTEAAELTKLLENTFRFVNISFINEMAILCDQLKVNIWEVVAAASSKPYGFTPFYPGPGIGGHCIPVDPFYLQWKLQEMKTSSHFISVSDFINTRIIQYIVSRTEELLKTKPLSTAKVLLYGVTYKKDVADIRDAPNLQIIEQLMEKGAAVYYHDPYIPSIKVANKDFSSIELTDELISKMDCVIILTDHSVLPLEQLLQQAPLVFDTRNVTLGKQGNATVVRLGDGTVL